MVLSRREFLASITGLTLLASTADSSLCAQLPTGRYALAGRVLTGEGTPPLTGHAVLIDNGCIEAIRPARTIKDRPVVAPPHATIMPGIINAHCHGLHTAAERRQRWLEFGVTSIGDVAAPLSAMEQLMDSPAGATATAAFSGPMLAPPGGYPLPVHNPNYALVVDSPATARDIVKRLADHGARLIKISFEPGGFLSDWPSFDPTTAQAICAQARKQGMKVRCHVEDLAGLEPALNAGVHCVEHVPHRWSEGSRMKPVLVSGNGKPEPIPYYRSLLERMVRDDVILTPTLDVQSRSPWNGPSLYEPVRAFHAMGGRIAMGNDYPYRRTEAGMPLSEMRLLAKAGLCENDIIQGATGTSASACNFIRRGTIAPGMAADMVIVGGNPLTNLDVMATPLHIVKDGIFIR